MHVAIRPLERTVHFLWNILCAFNLPEGIYQASSSVTLYSVWQSFGISQLGDLIQHLEISELLTQMSGQAASHFPAVKSLQNNGAGIGGPTRQTRVYGLKCLAVLQVTDIVWSSASLRAIVCHGKVGKHRDLISHDGHLVIAQERTDSIQRGVSHRNNI